jgi:2-keto-4-pentenoate hydratase
MPGALTAASDVARADVFRACFDGLGAVSVRFV